MPVKNDEIEKKAKTEMFLNEKYKIKPRLQ